MKKFIPIGNKVFIQPDSATNVSDGGIILANEKPVNTGIVLFVSREGNGSVKPGDRVRFLENAGIQEHDMLLIDETHILYIYGRDQKEGNDLPESGN